MRAQETSAYCPGTKAVFNVLPWNLLQSTGRQRPIKTDKENENEWDNQQKVPSGFQIVAGVQIPQPWIPDFRATL